MSPRVLVPLFLLLAAVGGVSLYLLDREERSELNRPERAAVEPATSRVSELAPSSGVAPVETPSATDTLRRVVDRPVGGEPTATAEATSKDDAQKARLTGRVVDPLGKPIAGAVVRSATSNFQLIAAEEMGDDQEWVSSGVERTETDEDGRFVLQSVRAGEPLLRVRSAGFAPTTFDHVRIAAGESLTLPEDLVLERSATLRGFVLDEGGLPVEGAKLDARPKGSGMFGFVGSSRGGIRSAADGSFELNELAREQLSLTVSHDAFARYRSTIDAREPRHLPSMEIRLPRGETIAGRVTGVPADEAGALVVIALPRSQNFTVGFDLRRGDVAADGSFVLRGLAADSSWNVQAIKAPQNEASDDVGMLWPDDENRVTEEIVATAGDQSVELPWQGALSVLVRVVNAETKAPIEHLSVSSGHGWLQELRDAEGEEIEHFPGGVVQLDGLRPDPDSDHFQLEIDARGYAKWERKDLVLERGRDLDLGTIELTPVPGVHVTVLDERTGMPVFGAKVSLRQAPKPDSNAGQASMAAMRVMATGDEDGQVIQSFSMDGAPEVRTAETDEQGLAILDSFEGEVCELTVRASDFAPSTVSEWELPRGAVVKRTVELGQGGAVAVLATDALGNPLPGRKVEHRAPGEGNGGEMTFFMGGSPPDGARVTDGEGVASFTRLAPGEHHFRLKKPSNRSGDMSGMVMFSSMSSSNKPDASWTSFVVVAGTEAQLTLAEAPTATFSGRITEHAEPLAKARVSLRKRAKRESARERALSDLAMSDMGGVLMGGGGGLSGRTDRKGRFELEGVEPGDYTLVVRHADRAMPYEVDVTLGSGEQQRDFDLPVALLAGRVVDPEGRGVAGLDVSAESVATEDSGPRERIEMNIVVSGGGGGAFGASSSGGGGVTTDSEGYFELRGVRSDVDIQVVARGAKLGWQEGRSAAVRVAADERREGVDVAVEPAGSIQVSVLAADGSAVDFVQLELRPDDDEGGETRREFLMGGTGKVTGLAPGRWSVKCTASGLPGGDGENEVTRIVEVVAGETLPLDMRLP